jgi:hypothetical protein
MKRIVFGLVVGLLLASLAIFPAAAQGQPPVCFWSDGGPVLVGRAVGADPEALLGALLGGPTPQEQAQGIWSALPPETSLLGVSVGADGTVVVRLGVPFEFALGLDHATHEVIVQQIAWTLEPVGWRDLRVLTWDPVGEEFLPLAAFLPRIPPPRKEAAPDEPDGARGPAYVGQPPAPGQGQPQGALSGRTVYVSAGHGWIWYSNLNEWRVQRIPYPRPPYLNPIIEDHNNAEVVNQFLLQYLWNAGATVIPVRERDMNPAEVIVDNDAPPPGTGYAETGTWTTTTAHGTGYAGTDYRWAETVTGAPTATAVWTATLPADGRFAVYAWYRQGSNRAPDAHYTVHHAGGTTEVVVDQRVHGSTWHYLGTYGFRGGAEAQVELTNESSAAGLAVIADAVRFGGGVVDDLSGIVTDADYPPYEPWWTVGAFYHTQRMGLDPAPYPDFGDVIARPIYARWEHAGTDEDAVYVSWHTNGATGYQWDFSGTVSYIHNGVDNPVTPGSADLRHAIHSELVHDLRAGWDAGWIDRGEHSLNLGELRELWDPDPAVALPGALIEIAFHDHPGDTDALKQPAFELIAARAVYQGILHYFDPAAVELPEPPTHLAVENVGAGRVRVSWQPSPTDAVGLVGDAATGYRVYTSPDGIGWSNGVSVSATTAYTLTGLSPDQLLFVRVSATNAGGESFPTETLAVRVADEAALLLVNGFDRLDRAMLLPDYYPVTAETHMRMILSQMNDYSYAVQHGEVITLPFDSASNEAVQAGGLDLDAYVMLDWIVGEESSVDETLNATEQALLADYLSAGGSLFVSGAEIAWDLDWLGGAGDRAFYNGSLRAAYAGDDAATYTVAPVSGSLFDGLGAFSFNAPTMYDPDYPDQLAPVGGSTAALVYQGGAGGVAGVQFVDECQRIVNFGFPFETIWPNQRAAVMARILDFPEGCWEQPLQTTITSPPDGAVLHATPLFQGTAYGGSGVVAVQVSVCRQSDGWCWDGAAWVPGTVWLDATGTTNWTAALPALAEDVYELQARARDGVGAVDPTPASVTFTLTVLGEDVFLPVVMRQEVSACADVLVNGGFESDDAWVLNQTASYATLVVHSGARSAHVGIPPDQPGPGAWAYASVSQSIALPTGSAATLRLWTYPFWEGDDANDGHYIVLYDQWDGYHLIDIWRSDARAWEQRVYDLSAYLGQTVELYIGTQNDLDDNTASMFIDDVSIEVCP